MLFRSAFLLLYSATIFIAAFVLMFSGLDAKSSFTAVLACINNMGPGLGVVGPSTNYQALDDLQVAVCTVVMLLGRLELITLLVPLTPTFWRK